MKYDLTNMRFGRLTVIERGEDHVSKNGKKALCWVCLCDCGNTITTDSRRLRNGSTKSCGCLQKDLARERAKITLDKRIDISGERFGLLVAVEPLRTGNHGVVWRCICDCGKEVNAEVASLRSGNTKSCGCLRDTKISNVNRKHGKSHTRLYNVWNGMRQRCKDPSHKSFHNYGGRGVFVCEEWDDFSVFQRWALSSGYDENAEYGMCSIDRIDVNGNYEPSNCRWVSYKEQAQNKRKK